MTSRGPLSGLPWRFAGRVPFERAIAENTAMAARVRADGQGAVLAFEPARPIYTLGRRASTGHDGAALEASLTLCRERGIGVVPVDRGGLGTLHLPGQLVLFVALACKREKTASVVASLLRAAAAIAQQHGQECRVAVGADAGVYTVVDGRERGKLASVGLRHSEGVLRHGMSVNVAVDLALAHGVSLCGRDDRGLADLSAGPGGPPSVEEVARAVATLLGLGPSWPSRAR